MNRWRQVNNTNNTNIQRPGLAGTIGRAFLGLGNTIVGGIKGGIDKMFNTEGVNRDMLSQLSNMTANGVYSQARRGTPGYWDCSSLVGTYLKNNGYNVNPMMTTASMTNELGKAGFNKIAFNPNDLQVGDILWRNGHTGIYLGGGQFYQARGQGKPIGSSNVFGKDGRNIYNFTHVFRAPSSINANDANTWG